jgi:hypothetical protein
MNSFSLRLADAGLRGEINVIGLVQMVADANEIPALSAFGDIASGIAASANGNAHSAEEAIGSVAALRGISRDLNEACALLVNTLASYALALSNFEAACTRMNDAVRAKIVELSSSET